MPGGETPAFNFRRANACNAAIINSPLTSPGLGGPSSKDRPLPARREADPHGAGLQRLFPEPATTELITCWVLLLPGDSHLLLLSPGLGNRGTPRTYTPTAWAGILAVPLRSCVTLKCHHLSVPPFYHLLLRATVRNKRVNICISA